MSAPAPRVEEYEGDDTTSQHEGGPSGCPDDLNVGPVEAEHEHESEQQHESEQSLPGACRLGIADRLEPAAGEPQRDDENQDEDPDDHHVGDVEVLVSGLNGEPDRVCDRRHEDDDERDEAPHCRVGEEALRARADLLEADRAGRGCGGGCVCHGCFSFSLCGTVCGNCGNCSRSGAERRPAKNGWWWADALLSKKGKPKKSITLYSARIQINAFKHAL